MSIVEVLNTINDGGALEDLRDAVQDVAKAVETTGKAGTVTLTLKVAKLGSGQVQIKDAVKSTVPRLESDPTIFFVADEGELTRDNPRQMRMSLA